MRLAFHAPMKPPGHPVPSGDREMARNLIAVLTAGGAQVDLASDLRTYDGAGDAETQRRLATAAAAEAVRLTAHWRQAGPPDAWITYHNYYKAPDLIGPVVSRDLGIPYVLIEATRAKKRLTSPWAGFAAAAEAACDAAALIFHLTDHDRDALERDRPPGQRLVRLAPFLPATTLPPAAALADSAPILTAAMMRAGDKLASYRIVAETLMLLGNGGWRLEIAGDGPARDEVERLMAPFGEQVLFLGRLDAPDMAAAYGRAGALLWPGVNEAFGMVYLEAQAAGLPVVAQDRPGVRDVLAPGRWPVPDDGPAALADELRTLISDATYRHARGHAGRHHVEARHLGGHAAATLLSALAPLVRAAS